MLPHNFDEVQNWFVVFQHRMRPRTRLVHFLLSDHFVHCLLIRELDEKRSLVIDPMQWGVAISVLDESVESLILGHNEETSAVLSHVADYRRMQNYHPRGPYTCVTIIKAILGLKKCPFVQTPFSLYRLLLKSEQTTIVKPYIPFQRNKPWAKF